MRKRSSGRGVQKFLLFIFGVVFLILSTWLYSNQESINHHSNIAAMLSQARNNVAPLQNDINDLQVYINNQDYKSLTRYVTTNLSKHRTWLADLLTGADESEPLAAFGIEYLALLQKLQIDDEVGFSGNHRKLLRLLEDMSQSETNVVALSKQRMLTNLDQLNSSIILADIILLLLIFTFFIVLVFSYWRFSSQAKLAYKYQRLSLYFTDHPSVLLRLSLNSRIKYYNKQADRFITQQKIDKYKLLPGNIAILVDQAIKCPEQTIRYKHQIEQHPMDCEIRFSKESQQIFITMVDSQQNTAKNSSVKQAV